ncbi:MAG: type II toxin-antitoxin system RelE/ParE family toxin [Selenomonadaceae bacterium]|nr:type II toxin-antitoxin system RelE/ParE family toxin [Selenomonadaceae bacterium]
MSVPVVFCSVILPIYFEGCENPRAKGKALEGEWEGYWRYRVGNYRLVAEIQDDKIIILIINVDKRNDIYK